MISTERLVQDLNTVRTSLEGLPAIDSKATSGLGTPINETVEAVIQMMKGTGHAKDLPDQVTKITPELLKGLTEEVNKVMPKYRLARGSWALGLSKKVSEGLEKEGLPEYMVRDPERFLNLMGIAPTLLKKLEEVQKPEYASIMAEVKPPKPPSDLTGGFKDASDPVVFNQSPESQPDQKIQLSSTTLSDEEIEKTEGLDDVTIVETSVRMVGQILNSKMGNQVDLEGITEGGALEVESQTALQQITSMVQMQQAGFLGVLKNIFDVGGDEDATYSPEIGKMFKTFVSGLPQENAGQVRAALNGALGLEENAGDEGLNMFVNSLDNLYKNGQLADFSLLKDKDKMSANDLLLAMFGEQGNILVELLNMICEWLFQKPLEDVFQDFKAGGFVNNIKEQVEGVVQRVKPAADSVYEAGVGPRKPGDLRDQVTGAATPPKPETPVEDTVKPTVPGQDQ